MPTYSYRCAACDVAFDQYQSFTDDSLTVCPNCGQPQLRKVFNAIGVTFNGSGFYRTDSRAKSERSDSSGSKSERSQSSSTSGDSSSSSSKAAAKPVAKPAASSGAAGSGSTSTT